MADEKRSHERFFAPPESMELKPKGWKPGKPLWTTDDETAAGTIDEQEAERLRRLQRFMAPPESMRIADKDEDLGEPLYDINDEDHAGRWRKEQQ